MRRVGPPAGRGGSARLEVSRGGGLVGREGYWREVLGCEERCDGCRSGTAIEKERFWKGMEEGENGRMKRGYVESYWCETFVMSGRVILEVWVRKGKES